jgi:CHAT domain-containing protein
MTKLPPALRLCALATSLGLASPSQAAPNSLSQRDSFRIGTSGVTCSAQNQSVNAALTNMFDRAYDIVCQDAATSIGTLYKIKTGAAVQPFAQALICGEPEAVKLAALDQTARRICTETATGLRYVRYEMAAKGTTYFAQGLAGYDSAIALGFRSLILDKAQVGVVEVAATEAGDAAAFARVQAGSLAPDQALVEGYSRNNIGNFPEAAEFFDTLLGRSATNDGIFSKSTEYAANQALQMSNLGKFAEADALFARAQKQLDISDPVLIRLVRNYRVIHALNRKDPSAALNIFGEKLEQQAAQSMAKARVESGFLDKPIVQRLNGEEKHLMALGGESGKLSATERALLLDAQGQHLIGAALRLQGRADLARTHQMAALAQIGQVRSGRVNSATWLRAAAMTELSSLSELTGDKAAARRQLEEVVALYTALYPGSPALVGAKARLGAMLARFGDVSTARTLFREAVSLTADDAGASANVRTYFGTYFDLLSATKGDPQAVEEFFTASQMLTRPGVAQTQAVFARELSGGSDEAAQLFRQSLNVTRDIVRLDADIHRLSQVEDAEDEIIQALVLARSKRVELAGHQAALLSKLSAFPQFRAVSEKRSTLSDLQAALRPGEGYYKLVLTDAATYAMFATNGGAQVLRLAVSPATLSRRVARLRDSIVRTENGAAIVDPFDVATARLLFTDLFGGIGAEIGKINQLVFEPDGPMLQLPVNLLIESDAGIAAYNARAAQENGDAFDLRGIAWLGRSKTVTTAVSPSAFLTVRSTTASKGTRAYLGIGENAPPPDGARRGLFADPCGWSAQTWAQPISSDELRIASTLFTRDRPELITKSDFTDAALLSRTDLKDFRIVHFATHGLVTPPKPECPARPALVSSFGAGDSDGLLSFREIFDLRLDANLVILSACDTAGAATVTSTREAGIATGGNFAMDGLVRAFVAAGSRSVVASHWPVPDDFDATKTLITGLLSGGKSSMGEALQRAQIKMMDNPLTSHPFYWSGFAIIGDASKSIGG